MRLVKAQLEERSVYLNVQQVVSFDLRPALDGQNSMSIRFHAVNGRTFYSAQTFRDEAEALRWLAEDSGVEVVR